MRPTKKTSAGKFKGRALQHPHGRQDRLWQRVSDPGVCIQPTAGNHKSTKRATVPEIQEHSMIVGQKMGFQCRRVSLGSMMTYSRTGVKGRCKTSTGSSFSTHASIEVGYKVKFRKHELNKLF